MNEEKMIKKQLLKNMILTFITFSLIFTVLDMIIYNQISLSIYNSIDKEIINAKEQSEQHGVILDKFVDGNNKTESIETNNPANNDTNPSDSTNADENNNPLSMDNENNDSTTKKNPPDTSKINNNRIYQNGGISPRLIYIIRDTDGNIVNEDSIGRFYDDYIADVSFNKEVINSNYTLSINETYFYRGINFTIIDADGQEYYVQILANVDGEMQTVKSTIQTLITTTIIMVLISIIVSYILSKRTLKPIVESWHRQTEFVQNASHELRTPLTIIQAKEELLLQEPNKKIIDKSQDITVCLNETRRLSKLIKELMTLARADSNKLEINKEQTDIDSLIKEVTEPYIEMAKLENKNVTLDLQYQKSINVDKNKIAQLLIIILDNAIKYTSEQENITITTSKKEGKLLIEVADTGIGISKEGIKHVFDRFYREDKARSRQTGGTGLGLSIARTIVMAHNGTIKITKNEPQGTKVTIKI